MASDDEIPSDGHKDNVGLPSDVADSQARRYRMFARNMACVENASEAARLTGYSETAAGNQGYRLMQRPEVLAMIEEEREARAHRLRITDERILAAYSAIAFGDARRVVEWDDNGEGEITPSSELTPDEALLVQGVERVEKTTATGDTIVTVKVRLAPRQPALDALAKIKGLLREKVDIDVSGGVADDMAQLRARRAERVAASNAARPIDVEVIDNEPRSANGDIAEEIRPKTNSDGPLTHDPRAEEITPTPGIAQRFAARTPREGE